MVNTRTLGAGMVYLFYVWLPIFRPHLQLHMSPAPALGAHIETTSPVEHHLTRVPAVNQILKKCIY